MLTLSPLFGRQEENMEPLDAKTRSLCTFDK
jgi:hypothetical protein